MDHYFPSPEIQELKPARPVPDRIRQCVGEYSSLRRSFTSLTKLTAITGTINVWVDPDGYLVTTGIDDGTKKWVEVKPLLFQEVKGQQRLAFRADGAGHITHLFRGHIPFNAFGKLRWYETPAFHNTVAKISLLVLLSALVVWPIVAFRARGRRTVQSPPRAARLLAWIMGMNFLLVANCVIDAGTDFGVSALLQSGLWLALAAVPLFAATAWFSVRAWPRKYWSLAGRIHYNLVTVAGLALLAWLYYWNLLGFHYR